MQDSCNKLVMTGKKQLKQATEQQASNDLRIIQDCIRIISENSKNPDIFFSRIIVSIMYQPMRFKKFLDNEQDAIYQFI